MVVDIDDYRAVWRHCFVICNLCLREWTAAVITSGPYECPTCHASAGQALEWYDADPMTLPQLLSKFPMEG